MLRQNARVIAGLVVVAVADALLFALARTESGDDALVVPLAASAGLTGFLVGRWWTVALALPLFVLIATLYEDEGYGELTFLGYLILVAGLVAGIQAAALALGVGGRWAVEHRSEVKEIFSS